MRGLLVLTFLGLGLAGISTGNPTTKIKVATTLENPPYCSFNSDTNDYEGFIPELLDNLGINYEFVSPSDGKYGTMDPETKTWDGMVGMVMNGEADMVAVDLTVTAKRSEHLDFSYPFASHGLTVITKKSKTQSPPTLEIGGYYLDPTHWKPVVGRSLGDYSSIKEMLDDPDFKLGTYCCGSTHNLIMSSEDPLIQQINDKLTSQDTETTLAQSNREGVDWVLERKKFGYIMEGATAKYVTTKYCNLYTVESFADRHYALAFKKGSPLVAEMNQRLLRMSENNELSHLRRKWFEKNAVQCK